MSLSDGARNPVAAWDHVWRQKYAAAYGEEILDVPPALATQHPNSPMFKGRDFGLLKRLVRRFRGPRR